MPTLIGRLYSRNKSTFLFISLLLVTITIPLKNQWNSAAIIIFNFAALIQQPLIEAIRKLKVRRYWILSVLFFFWVLLTWTWDSSGQPFLKYIERYYIFLSLPILFSILPPLTIRQLSILCYAFTATILILSLIALYRSYKEFAVTGDSRLFYYHYLGYQVKLNAVFFSNYSLACITWLLYFHFIRKKDDVLRFSKPLVMVVCVYLFVFMFFLSSKLILALTLGMLIFLVIYITRFKNIIITSGILVLMLGGAFLLTRNLYYLKFRLDVTDFKSYDGTNDNNGLAARLLMWDAACQLIRERPIQGYGLKAAQQKLEKKYADRGFELGIREHYNSHNQYLQSWLTTGLPGLLLFLAVLFIPLMEAYQKKKLLLILMLIHYILMSITDATLTVQQELVFFWFFIWLFYYSLTGSGIKKTNPVDGTPSLSV